MKNVVVVGSQWGDEGKGKIVDWLSSEADVIIRFQGGHNAGHTLVIDDNVFKLSLLPSGIVRDNTIVLIGNGVVIDPFHLAIIFIANLEIGFLTPPVGMNLFLAAYRFNEPMPQIYLATLPFFVIKLIAVALITYVPILTLGLFNF